MINSISPNDADVLAIQEPYFDFLNRTRATNCWTIVLPHGHYKDGADRTRALILVSNQVQDWEQVKIESPDVTAIKIKTINKEILIANLYCDGEHSKAIEATATITKQEQQRLGSQLEVIWVGDFNRHHPLWDELRNSHLFTSNNLDKAEELIVTIDELEMQMILPANIPTLKAMSTGNRTRPDNVFASAGIAEEILECNAHEEDIPPNTDHFPIKTVCRIRANKVEDKEIPNFKQVEWNKFREVLKEKITAIRTDEEVADQQDFDARLTTLTEAIKATINETVPRSRITTFTKRWWTKELTTMKSELKEKRKESIRRQWNPDDPAHEIERQARNQYSQAIKDAKTAHWDNFLKGIDEQSIWTAHKYVTGEPTDGARSKMPPLKSKSDNGEETLAEEDKSKAELLFKAFFANKESYELPPREAKYPKPAFAYQPITNGQIKNAIERLSPYKAPGANGIPNVVLTKTAELIIPIIGPLFRASVKLKYFPQVWKDSTIVVIRKPGKPDYAVPGAYRPIALLDTIGKVFSSCIAEDLATHAETHGILPDNQFGCRPGRTTTDALHYAVTFIKDAWRRGDEVMALFLDIKAAFPSVLPEWLIHNLRKRGIPKQYAEWYKTMLEGRRTILSFDNYRSEPLPLTIGLDQGRPDSGIAYALYSADLAEIVKNHKYQEAICFADDTTLMVRAKTLEDGAMILADIMDEANKWSERHNCQFATDKFALMGFSRKRAPDPGDPKKTRPKARPSLRIKDLEIKPVAHHKFLGIIVDQELRFNEHVDYALKKGFKWVSQFRRLAKPSKGVAMRHMRRYYPAVATPRMLYAAEILLVQETDELKGTKGKIRKLARVQREAGILITGALRTTAGDTLDAHANLLPFPLLVEKSIRRAATRLATIPESHALHRCIKRAASRNVKRHKSPLHEILHRNQIKPENFEKIKPTLWGPKWTCEHKVIIPDDREKAIEDMDKYNGCHIVYSDGSGRDGKIGAAAVYKDNRGRKQVRRILLGEATQHTVYEAELAGIILALDIAKSIKYTGEVYIMLDNQAAIRATTKQRAAPGQRLVEIIQREIGGIRKRQRKKIVLVWSPGHEEIEGNEEADEEAGRATAEGDKNIDHIASLKCRPISRSAARQHHNDLLTKRAKAIWDDSPRGQKMKAIDELLPGGDYLKTIDRLPRNGAALLTQLRTGHIPLNYFLHKIGKVESPLCLACELDKETVVHYLCTCPRYDNLRLKIQRHFRQHAVSRKTLLSNPKATKLLMEYVNGTKRFEKSYGEIAMPTDQPGKRSKTKRRNRRERK